MSDSRNSVVSLFVYAAILAVWLIAITAGGCSADKTKAARTVEASGMSDVELGGYPWLECGGGDVFNSEFTASTARGARVSGAVCCGLFKGCTVRMR